jgi:hypothetical protein
VELDVVELERWRAFEGERVGGFEAVVLLVLEVALERVRWVPMVEEAMFGA